MVGKCNISIQCFPPSRPGDVLHVATRLPGRPSLRRPPSRAVCSFIWTDCLPVRITIYLFILKSRRPANGWLAKHFPPPLIHALLSHWYQHLWLISSHANCLLWKQPRTDASAEINYEEHARLYPWRWSACLCASACASVRLCVETPTRDSSLGI